MAQAVQTEQVVRVNCACGQEMRLEPQLLGRIIRCLHCGRYVRVGLQFLLIDRSWAPNLTVQCACGRFIVETPDKVGKQVRCKACKRQLVMPQPVVKFDSNGLVRVPRKILENQLNRGKLRQERAPKEMTRLESAGHAGRITLGPGQHICVNPNCGALMRARANVCSKCGTNRLTGKRYEAKGPAADPQGTWKQV